MSTVERVKFLWDASMTLNPTATHLNKLLKSHLRNTCRSLAGTNTAIPLERFSESQMCKRCSLHWQENDFHIKYKAQGLQITKNKTKKLLKRLNEQEAGKTQKLLTRKQKKRAKWLLKKSKNSLDIQCEFCKEKTVIALEKPVKLKEAKKIVPVAVENVQANAVKTKKKSKKNKPKDRTAGLKILPKTVETAKVNLNTNSEKEAKTKDLPKTINKQPTKPKIIMPKAEPIQLNKPLVKANLKKKAKGHITSTSKVQTKTQKQNSLLQLAALLKKQENTSDAKNNLQALLK